MSVKTLVLIVGDLGPLPTERLLPAIGELVSLYLAGLLVYGFGGIGCASSLLSRACTTQTLTFTFADDRSRCLCGRGGS